MATSIEAQQPSKGSHADLAKQDTTARPGSAFAAFIVRERQPASYRILGIEHSLTILHPLADLHLRLFTSLRT